MRPRFFTSVLLFISAYSPLFLMLAVRDFDFKGKHWFCDPIAMYILLGITVASTILLFVVLDRMHPGDLFVKIVSAKNRSVDIIGYTIPYMVAFFGIDLSKLDDVIVLIIFLLVLLLLTIASKAIFLNPILVIAGYGLYEIEYEHRGRTHSITVVSKFELHNGDSFYIRSLSRFLYFVKQKNTNSNDAT